MVSSGNKIHPQILLIQLTSSTAAHHWKRKQVKETKERGKSEGSRHASSISRCTK